MFNRKKLKEKDRIIATLRRKLDNAIRNSYRIGDKVYIDMKGFALDRPYYLLEHYNNRTCWFVSENPNDTTRRALFNAVSVHNITMQAPDSCPRCHSALRFKDDNI